ncbi:hypothetical protein Tco_0731380 [Tanacetum coccineum]
MLPPTVKIVLNKRKQVWKATSKLFANVGYQWRPTGKKFTSGKLNCGYQWRPTGKKFALGELCPLTRLPVTCGTNHHLVSGLRLFKTQFRGMNGSSGPTIEDTSITQADLHPSVNPVEGEPSSAQSTSGDVSLAEPNQVNQPPDHLRKWTKDHPLDNIVGNPSRPVSTRKQLASDALCYKDGKVRSKCENKGIVPTEMELVLEYTQQGASHEVSDHLKMEMEMEIPSVKASANSDIIFFFTSAQDGNKLLDDERLSLADDLKKAHDQNQNKSK